MAEASNAVIIGFNVRPTPQARQQAESDSVEIRLHSIIYKVIEEVEDAMKGMLDPEYQEKIIGEALIRETFKVSKVGTIGGFMVISGKVTRDSKVRVIRDGVVIYDGQLASLKHFKDDVKEVTNGREGGLMIEGYNDIQVDDTIEAYIMEEIKKLKLNPEVFKSVFMRSKLMGMTDSTEILDQVISQNETAGFYNQIKIS